MTKNNISNPYLNFVMNNIVPRILTKLDRDYTSQTYGCFDRKYWHYRINDFPSLIEQQPMLALAQLYTWKDKSNIYYKNEKIREYILAALNFWKNKLHSDGSGDEYWPNEHSYPPTVFPLFAACESYKLLNLNNDSLKRAMLKSVNFISKWKEKGAVNQEIASIAALYSAYTILKKKSILIIIDNKLKKIIPLQTKEGWFPEYGGADLGYLSVALDYAANYYHLSKDSRILPLIENMIGFIKYFVHPDGTFGGDYGSRNTEYFLLHGLELLSQKYPLARRIADKLLENINTAYYLHNGIDDRYLCDYCGRSFVGAMISYSPQSVNIKLPYELEFEKWFAYSKIYIKSTKSVYIIVNLLKGGIVKVYSKQSNKHIENKEGLLFSDCGYNIINSKNILTTNWLEYEYNILINKNNLFVDGVFHKQSLFVLTPLTSILLRFAAKLLGKLLIPFAKRIMISSQSISLVTFKRSISLSDESLIIHDFISSPFIIKKLCSINRFSLRYVPSSRFFQINDLFIINKERKYFNIKKLELKKRFDFFKKEEKILNVKIIN